MARVTIGQLEVEVQEATLRTAKRVSAELEVAQTAEGLGALSAWARAIHHLIAENNSTVTIDDLEANLPMSRVLETYWDVAEAAGFAKRPVPGEAGSP